MSGAEVYDTILDVAPSPLDQKIVWVSTDDGLVQVSRDGARTWYNVTPRSVPAWSRIPTVEPGWFERGYAYVVVDRHMSGDDQPYVFETTDFGRTWRSIAGDLPRGLFARVIRQDRKNPRILYLGTQRGVYVTLDGGAHWRSLRLNMPASAVYDIEIQPQRNDLVVGTHGRGVWILDDLAVVQRANDGNGKVELIAPRDAFRMWQWAPLLTFDTADPLPRNEFYGRNAPLAMFTYVLMGAEPSTPDIEILDEQRRIVRHLGGLQRYAGIHRVEWDLSEDGPVILTHGPRFDRGPEEGPEVLPGNYIVRLVVGKRAYEQPLAVRRDPRDPATAQQYQSRHAFLTQLFAQFSRVDRLINSIDDRMDRGDTARGLSVLRDRLTQHARNELELLAKPPRVRERILNELGRMSSSFQAPTEADWQQEREFENVIASCERDFARYGRP